MRQIDTQSDISTGPLPLPANQRTALLDEEQFRTRLAQFADATGGKAELARRLGVTGQFIGYVINGERRPGKKLLAALGAKRRVMIEIEVEAE